jgi:hypothetical protein
MAHLENLKFWRGSGRAKADAEICFYDCKDALDKVHSGIASYPTANCLASVLVKVNCLQSTTFETVLPCDLSHMSGPLPGPDHFERLLAVASGMVRRVRTRVL